MFSRVSSGWIKPQKCEEKAETGVSTKKNYNKYMEWYSMSLVMKKEKKKKQIFPNITFKKIIVTAWKVATFWVENKPTQSFPDAAAGSYTRVTKILQAQLGGNRYILLFKKYFPVCFKFSTLTISCFTVGTIRSFFSAAPTAYGMCYAVVAAKLDS